MTFALPAATDATYEQCPIGLFVFKLKDMERGIQGAAEYGGGERVKWTFIIERIIDANENEPSRDVPEPLPLEEWVGKEFWAFSSLSMGKKATMRQWASALLAREIGEGEQISASDLIGKRAKATVARNENARQKITSLVPYKQAARRVAEEPEEGDPF